LVNCQVKIVKIFIIVDKFKRRTNDTLTGKNKGENRMPEPLKLILQKIRKEGNNAMQLGAVAELKEDGEIFIYDKDIMNIFGGGSQPGTPILFVPLVTLKPGPGATYTNRVKFFTMGATFTKGDLIQESTTTWNYYLAKRNFTSAMPPAADSTNLIDVTVYCNIPVNVIIGMDGTTPVTTTQIGMKLDNSFPLFAGTGTLKNIYRFDNKFWICLNNTTVEPSVDSTDWFNLTPLGIIVRIP